jgi:hypothetical protein
MKETNPAIFRLYKLNNNAFILLDPYKDGGGSRLVLDTELIWHLIGLTE